MAFLIVVGVVVVGVVAAAWCVDRRNRNHSWDPGTVAELRHHGGVTEQDATENRELFRNGGGWNGWSGP